MGDLLSDGYINELLNLRQVVQDRFREVLDHLQCHTIPQRLEFLNNSLNELKTFDNPKKKIQDINVTLTGIEDVIVNFCGSPTERVSFFKPIKESVDDVIALYEAKSHDIHSKVESLFNEIIHCPSGDKAYGNMFQCLVLEFLDVIFIHEFDRFVFGLRQDDGRSREEEWKVEMKRTYGSYRIGSWLKKLDGYYVKRDSFDAIDRVGFDFKGMIVECKNKRPTIDDLLQCFRYTLYFQNTRISTVPLSLLICRHAPGQNSTVWDMNKRIFDKPIGNETRLILILTLDDLLQMKQYRVNDGDPALVLKNIINDFH
jgi:hypothetical protein